MSFVTGLYRGVILRYENSSFDSSSSKTMADGLPRSVEIYKTSNGELKILPAEGGGLGYGIGKALSNGEKRK